MIEAITRFGQNGVNACAELGQSGAMLWRMLFRRPRPIRSFPLLIEQIYHVGLLSLVIILVSALFIGMVLALQGHNTLQRFGAEQQLGQLVALSVVRELGPVVTALLFAGRAGSALTAEIGLMKSTEQLASMEIMAVDPLWRIVSPRFWAGFISMPILAVVFSMTAVFGGYIVGVLWLGIDAGSFWSNMQAAVDFRIDVVNGIIKSFVFGFIVTWIAMYQGYFCQPNAAGIAKATTRTVVYGSLGVLGADFLLTTMMLQGW